VVTNLKKGVTREPGQKVYPLYRALQKSTSGRNRNKTNCLVEKKKKKKKGEKKKSGYKKLRGRRKNRGGVGL